jgi:uncharacterized protein
LPQTIRFVKLHADSRNAAYNTVTGYFPGGIEINATPYHHSICMMPEGPVQAWSLAQMADLQAEHLAPMLDLAPELVVLGTGSKQQFAPARLVALLTSKRIGLEIMNTAAACRTYNILMAEGRKVLGAFIVEPNAEHNAQPVAQAVAEPL